MRNALCPVVFIAVLASQSPAQGPYPGWSDSLRIYINTTEDGKDTPDGEPVITQAVSDFPLLVRVQHDTALVDFTEMQPDGDDIRFAASDGTPLPYELERFANDSAVLWVRVPQIQPNSMVQYIVMYWGNGSAVSESNGEAVFAASDGYQGVWHLGDDFADATSNGRDGSDSVASTGKLGVCGQGQEFREATNDNIGIPSNAAITTAFTISFWVYIDSVVYSNGPTMDILNSYQYNGGTGMGIRLLQSQAVLQSSSNSWDNATAMVSRGSWRHVVFTMSGGTVDKYANAGLRGSTTGFSFLPPETLPRLGYPNSDSIDNYSWFIDELREENVGRDSTWVKLCYQSQHPRSNLLVPGGVTCQEPSILIQPTSTSIPEDETASFTIIATGTNLRYQWYKTYRPIPGATAATLSYTPDSTDSGTIQIFCSVSGDCGGAVQSAIVTLTILPSGVIAARTRLPVATDRVWRMFDITGRLVGTADRPPRRLPAGVRFIQSTVDGRTSVRQRLTAD